MVTRCTLYNIRHEIADYLKTHYIDRLILTEAYQDNNDNLSLLKEFNINNSFHLEAKRGIIILTKKLLRSTKWILLRMDT